MLTRIRDSLTNALTIFSIITAPFSIAEEVGSVPLSPQRDVYFGNFHVHTAWSFDAYINGAASDPDSAYRWAKGEEIAGGGDGTPLRIKVPLDWYIVSDHAEYLGALPLMGDPDSPVSKHASQLPAWCSSISDPLGWSMRILAPLWLLGSGVASGRKDRSPYP